MPKVSVVIPTFNRSFTLIRALESVLGQTMQDLEILVVDDGSTDGTASAVASFVSDKLRYIRLSWNRGGSVARNAGISLAQSEFVAFLDDDDSWEPDKIELQLQTVTGATPGEEVGEGDWCRTGVGIYTTDGRYERYVFRALPFDDPYKSIMSDNYIGGTSSILVRRKCLKTIGGFDEGLPALQDWDLYIRLIKNGCRLRGIDTQLVRYFKTYVAGSVSGSFHRFKMASAMMRRKYRDDQYYTMLNKRLKIIELKRLFKSMPFLMEAVRYYGALGHSNST
jgi:glycosyltransferase involved in cell wall biosynthesis